MREYWLLDHDEDRRVVVVTAAEFFSRRVREWYSLLKPGRVAALLHIIASGHQHHRINARILRFQTDHDTTCTCKPLDEIIFQVEFDAKALRHTR